MAKIDTPCATCDAHCCRHVAIGIDAPKNKKDYENIRWYLLHENVWLSIDHTDTWLLEFRTPCRNIDSENRCSDYANRPKICRDYPGKNEICEKATDEPSYKHLFTCAEEFDLYLKNKSKSRKKKTEL